MSEQRRVGGAAWTALRAGLAATLVALVAPASLFAAELADPTRPPFLTGLRGATRSGPSPERLVLSSVLISAGRRVAVINGRRGRLGSTVDGATVVEIEPRYVRLERSGAPVELFLRSPVVKTERIADE